MWVRSVMFSVCVYFGHIHIWPVIYIRWRTYGIISHLSKAKLPGLVLIPPSLLCLGTDKLFSRTQETFSRKIKKIINNGNSEDRHHRRSKAFKRKQQAR